MLSIFSGSSMKTTGSQFRTRSIRFDAGAFGGFAEFAFHVREHGPGLEFKGALERGDGNLGGAFAIVPGGSHGVHDPGASSPALAGGNGGALGLAEGFGGAIQP